MRYQKKPNNSAPLPRTAAQQLAQDVARRNAPAPAAPAAPAPASPAAPAMAPATAPARRAPVVNELARDVARAGMGTGPQRQAFGGGVPDIPDQQPDLTPRPDRPSRPAPPPPPGSLQDPRDRLRGTQPPSTTTVTMEAAPGVLEAAYGSGAGGPPYDSVTLEAAPGALDNINFDEFMAGGGAGGAGAAGGQPINEQEAIDAAIRDLITEQPDVAAEREAMIGEMRSQQARDIQSMRARTGLGGMGLTGAAGALESQVRQETAREQALTTADFDRQARAEALDRLLKGVDLRRSEQVFEKAMDLFAKEEGAAIPPLDGNGDGTVTDEERAAHRAAIEQAATTAAAESGARASAEDTARSAEIEGMSSSAFEDGINEKELKRLGWTIAGPKGSEDGRWYYEWTSPNGVVKRAFVDDAFEFSSGGLEWA